MLEISIDDIQRRVIRDNPWWSSKSTKGLRWRDLTRRDYFKTFYKISTNTTVKRSTVLLGPRRVGKTVMLHHFIYQLIDKGINPKNVLYLSIDAPVYSNIALEKMLLIFQGINKISDDELCYVIFDEVQYLKDWETHLKDLTDAYPNVKFIVSGSAASALRLKSRESGAGRFSDFMLPPLTFLEFTKFVGKLDSCVNFSGDYYDLKDIEELNKCFINYINYGGFPEVALDDYIQANLDAFIKSDIVDKVLLKDLPNLHGITNTQDLNNIFKLLAYNNGQEVGLEAIAKQSQIQKVHIKNFIEYLDSAFLISQHDKLPTSGKQLVRKRNFKVFLTNPSMRAALFSPVDPADSTTIGHLAEAAILSQWDHLSRSLQNYYYRDPAGNEVDIVGQDAGTLRPTRPVEVKWSDSTVRNPKSSLKGLIYLLNKYDLKQGIVTSKTIRQTVVIDNRKILVIPTSLYCLNIGSMTSEMAMADRIGENEHLAQLAAE